MLVLSRKAGERIHIGDQITVEVRRIAGNRVTLALRAPKAVRILRGELQKIATEFETVEFEAVEVAPELNGISPEPEAKLPLAIVNDSAVQIGIYAATDPS